jgi:hypothetical protein
MAACMQLLATFPSERLNLWAPAERGLQGNATPRRSFTRQKILLPSRLCMIMRKIGFLAD